jgi:hypothetical protein
MRAFRECILSLLRFPVIATKTMTAGIGARPAALIVLHVDKAGFFGLGLPAVVIPGLCAAPKTVARLFNKRGIAPMARLTVRDVRVHIDGVEQRPDILTEQVEACPTCSCELEQGYGMAGGGLGVYGYCPRCERVIWKCQTD